MNKKRKNIESSFKIHNVLLLESSFMRVANVVFDNKTVEQKVDIKSDVNVDSKNKIVSVTITLEYAQIFEEIGRASCRERV